MLKAIYRQWSASVKHVFSYFFIDDLAVMSEEVREIMSNREDAKKYREAVDRIAKGENSVKVEFSNGNRLTLIR